MRFWDSSAVVPLLIEQDATPCVSQALAQDAEIAAWWGTLVECGSAIARLERDGLLEVSASATAGARLQALAQTWHEVQPSEAVRRAAQRLLRLHPLRSMEALQGAAAMVLAEHDPTTLNVVCMDSHLTDALRREGFAVLVPS